MAAAEDVLGVGGGDLELEGGGELAQAGLGEVLEDGALVGEGYAQVGA